MEQKQKLFCLILFGPLVQKHQDFSKVMSNLPTEIFHVQFMIQVFNMGMMVMVTIKLQQDKMVQLVERLFSHRCDVPVRKVPHILRLS